MKNIHWIITPIIASGPFILVIFHKAKFIQSEFIEKHLIHQDSLDQLNIFGILTLWYIVSSIIGLWIDDRLYD